MIDNHCSASRGGSLLWDLQVQLSLLVKHDWFCCQWNTQRFVVLCKTAKNGLEKETGIWVFHVTIRSIPPGIRILCFKVVGAWEESPPGLNLCARANGGVFGVLRLGSSPCTPGITLSSFRRDVCAWLVTWSLWCGWRPGVGSM